MVPATELRIGNYLKIRGDYSPIAIGWFYVLAKGEAPEHEPIPLTPEILEKCGFEAMTSAEEGEDVDYAATGWRAYYNAPYTVGGKDHFCIWDNQPDGYLMDNYSAAPLKYLHQLQNLFHSLTGEELNCQL